MWEHVYKNCSIRDADLALAQMSDAGWELVAVTRTDTMFQMFFKRPDRSQMIADPPPPAGAE